MKKSYLFLSLVLAVLVLSSCDGSNNNDTTRGNPYRGGTESLSISFEQGMPPRETFSDIPFDVSLRARNVGEYAIPSGALIVNLQGFDPSAYGKTVQYMTQTSDRELLGTIYDVNRNLIQGDEEYFDFMSFEYQSDLTVTLSNVPIRATVWYPYGTYAESNLCIKRDSSRDRPGDVCNINEAKSLFVSSGPVQVASFEQATRGSSSTSFSFRVVHRGTGELYDPAVTFENHGDRDRNKVRVTLGGVDNIDNLVECSALGGGTSGTVTLTDADGRLVTCTVDVSNVPSDYVQRMNIELEYNYKQSITSTIDIKPSN